MSNAIIFPGVSFLIGAALKRVLGVGLRSRLLMVIHDAQHDYVAELETETGSHFAIRNFLVNSLSPGDIFSNLAKTTAQIPSSGCPKK